MTSTLSPDAILIPDHDTQMDLVDGEAILVHPRSQRVRMLNETGTLVWTESDGKRSLAEVAVLLSQMYNIDPQQAERDVVQFAEALLAAGLARLATINNPV
jgi:hypothetical protein